MAETAATAAGVKTQLTEHEAVMPEMALVVVMAVAGLTVVEYYCFIRI
jgi:hypothetical protein